MHVCYRFATQTPYDASIAARIAASTFAAASSCIPGKDVAVKVKGDPYARMAEALLRHFGMNAVQQEMRRMRVPQIVEPNARQI